jgi:hypothetical protein
VRHQLAQTEAEFLREVISAQHVFLEDDQSLEVLLVQGPAIRLKELCDRCAGCAVCSSSNSSPPRRSCRPFMNRGMSRMPSGKEQANEPDFGQPAGRARSRPRHGRHTGRHHADHPPVASDLPEDVSADDLLWEETIAAGGYATRRLARGTRLRLIDLQGDACASLMLFNAEMPTERLNVADTVKVQWNAYLEPESCCFRIWAAC